MSRGRDLYPSDYRDGPGLHVIADVTRLEASRGQAAGSRSVSLAVGSAPAGSGAAGLAVGGRGSMGVPAGLAHSLAQAIASDLAELQTALGRVRKLTRAVQQRPKLSLRTKAQLDASAAEVSAVQARLTASFAEVVRLGLGADDTLVSLGRQYQSVKRSAASALHEVAALRTQSAAESVEDAAAAVAWDSARLDIHGPGLALLTEPEEAQGGAAAAGAGAGRRGSQRGLAGAGGAGAARREGREGGSRNGPSPTSPLTLMYRGAASPYDDVVAAGTRDSIGAVATAGRRLAGAASPPLLQQQQQQQEGRIAAARRESREGGTGGTAGVRVVPMRSMGTHEAYHESEDDDATADLARHYHPHNLQQVQQHQQQQQQQQRQLMLREEASRSAAADLLQQDADLAMLALERKDRDAALMRIASDSRDAQAMFGAMAELTTAQGERIDSIEDAVLQSRQRVTAARKEVVKLARSERHPLGVAGAVLGAAAAVPLGLLVVGVGAKAALIMGAGGAAFGALVGRGVSGALAGANARSGMRPRPAIHDRGDGRIEGEGGAAAAAAPAAAAGGAAVGGAGEIGAASPKRGESDKAGGSPEGDVAKGWPSRANSDKAKSPEAPRRDNSIGHPRSSPQPAPATPGSGADTGSGGWSPFSGTALTADSPYPTSTYPTSTAPPQRAGLVGQSQHYPQGYSPVPAGGLVSASALTAGGEDSDVDDDVDGVYGGRIRPRNAGQQQRLLQQQQWQQQQQQQEQRDREQRERERRPAWDAGLAAPRSGAARAAAAASAATVETAAAPPRARSGSGVASSTGGRVAAGAGAGTASDHLPLYLRTPDADARVEPAMGATNASSASMASATSSALRPPSPVVFPDSNSVEGGLLGQTLAGMVQSGAGALNEGVVSMLGWIAGTGGAAGGRGRRTGAWASDRATSDAAAAAPASAAAPRSPPLSTTAGPHRLSAAYAPGPAAAPVFAVPDAPSPSASLPSSSAAAAAAAAAAPMPGQYGEGLRASAAASATEAFSWSGFESREERRRRRRKDATPAGPPSSAPGLE